MKAIRAGSTASGGLGRIESENLRIASALELEQAGERGWESLVKMDSTVSSSWNNLAVSHSTVADNLFHLGRVEESIRKRKDSVAVADKIQVDAFLALNLAFWNAWLADAQANFGESDKGALALFAAREFNALAAKQTANSGGRRELVHEQAELLAANVLLTNGKHAEFLEKAGEALGRMRVTQVEGRIQEDVKRRWQGYALELMSRAKYETGDYAGAETAARESLELLSGATRRSLRDDLIVNEARTALAIAIARQGRLREADGIIQPVVAFHRKLQGARVDDVVQKALNSRALLVSALANPRERTARLAEAAAILDRLPPQARRWKAFMALRDEIAAEEKKRL